LEGRSIGIEGSKVKEEKEVVPENDGKRTNDQRGNELEEGKKTGLNLRTKEVRRVGGTKNEGTEIKRKGLGGKEPREREWEGRESLPGKRPKNRKGKSNGGGESEGGGKGGNVLKKEIIIPRRPTEEKKVEFGGNCTVWRLQAGKGVVNEKEILREKKREKARARTQKDEPSRRGEEREGGRTLSRKKVQKKI